MLQLYWKKGVDVIQFLAENSGDPHLLRIKETAEHHARLKESSSQSSEADKAASQDSTDDGKKEKKEEEEGQVIESSSALSHKATNTKQRNKSLKEEKAIFENIEDCLSSGYQVRLV